MAMEKSTQPQGLASLNKSLKTQPTSSQKQVFDYDLEEASADNFTQNNPVLDTVVDSLRAKYG